LFHKLARSGEIRDIMGDINIFPSVRVRKTPFWDRVVEAGVKSCSVYNRMLLPVHFETAEIDYFHLKEHVQLWDVACERQIEVIGPDATRLIKLLSPRPIDNLKVGKCLYFPVVDQYGGMLNDPVLLKFSDIRYWLSIADSDYLLWVLALAAAFNINARVFEPDVSPLGVQGPKSDELMARVFGKEMTKLKFFDFMTLEFQGKEHYVSRSGYSKQGGFEIYVEGSENGIPIWDALMEAGEDLSVRAGGPNYPERVEGGLLSYGTDMTMKHTPYESGLGKYCDVHSTPDCIGYDSLMDVFEIGWDREIRSLAIEGERVPLCHVPWKVTVDGEFAGHVTSVVWSPGYKTNVAIGMIEKDFWHPDTEVLVHAPDHPRKGKVRQSFYT